MVKSIENLRYLSENSATGRWFLRILKQNILILEKI